MNSPEDEIPLPSEPVLSDEETLRQLRADSVRQYTEQIKALEQKLSEWKAMAQEFAEIVAHVGYRSAEHYDVIADACKATTKFTEMNKKYDF